MQRVALLLSLLFFSRVGLAFPEMGRLGYSSCQSCHVSPTGGGVLNKYGRSVADDFLGTWSYEGAGQNLFGLADTPEWLDIGGDTRTIRLLMDTGAERIPPRTFLMQSDLELALHLGPRITVAGAYGYYGIPLPVNLLDEVKPEARRYYVLIKPYEWLSIRSGKFYPAYGLMIPDHTVNIRAGLFWPQGGETTNTEIGFWQQWGEVAFTHVSSEPDKGRSQALALRASAYIGQSGQAGFSLYQNDKSSAYGLFGIFGFTKKFYLMAEADYKTSSGVDIYQLWGGAGLELFKGFLVLANTFATVVDPGGSTGYGYGLQWFPFPHFEFLAKIESVRNERGSISSYILMGHYYL
jgi:hypothetical protein